MSVSFATCSFYVHLYNNNCFIKVPEYTNGFKMGDTDQDLLDSNRPGITHKHSVSRKKGRPIVSGYEVSYIIQSFQPFCLYYVTRIL